MEGWTGVINTHTGLLFVLHIMIRQHVELNEERGASTVLHACTHLVPCTGTSMTGQDMIR